MSQSTRKRQHQQQSPPLVKEEQPEEADTQSSIGAAGISVSQSCSSNFENSNTIRIGPDTGNDDINQLKLKVAVLEAKNQILEGKLEYHELNARIHAMSLKQENTALWMRLNEVEKNAQTAEKKMMDEFRKRLIALEAKVEPKRLCNPVENYWRPNTGKATMKVTLPDQLNVHNTSYRWGDIIALKGFLISAACRPKQNYFAGPILYYYEITIMSPWPLVSNEGRLCIGFCTGSIKKDSWIGLTPNTYAMRDNKRDYCTLSEETRFFEWPAGAIKPKLYGCGDVFGCGLVSSADNKLAVFFTNNGILMGQSHVHIRKGNYEQ